MSVTSTGLRDRVKFHCKPGFMLLGSPTATCTLSGSWSSRAPTCARACTYPGALHGGSMSRVRFYYSPGEEVTFTCRTGDDHDSTLINALLIISFQV